MTYTVTYLNATGGELSTFVEADKVEFDAHWVSFRRNLPPDVVHTGGDCDNCGRSVTRPRVSAFAKSDIVAIYPAHRVRRVEESRTDGE